MKPINNYIKEPQVLSALLTGMYLEMLTNTIEWEASLKKIRTDAENILDQFNKYASLGIIDEYQCAYASLKNYFQSAIEDAEELGEVIKNYRRQFLGTFFANEYESQKEFIGIKHEGIRDAVLDFLAGLTYKMNEFYAIFSNISFSGSDLSYSLEF